MKAIILAAGYGGRMRPLTNSEHKTLLTIDGATIISRIIDGLYDNGVTDIVVGTGYMAERVQTYLETNYPNIDFTFVENASFRTTNNIHTLSMIFDRVKIDDDVILIESDLTYEPAVIKRLIDSPKENVALVDHYKHGMDGTVVTVSNGVITSIIPPHLQGHDFNFSDKFKTLNIYKFSQSFSNRVFKRLLGYYAIAIDQNAYYEWILGILIYVQKATIHAEVLDNERWAEVDDPNDLERASFVFARDKRLDILQESFGGYWNYDILDFCFLRNMYFPTPAILSELQNNFQNLVFNYGSTQAILNKKLAHFLLCRREHVTLLNGASQVYPILRLLYGDKKALLPRPTFAEYPRIFANAAFYDDRVGTDPADIVDRGRDCDLVVIVNPNSPTGSHLDTSWIISFAERYPHKMIIVDESFIEFAPIPSITAHLEQHSLSNVMVIKSLSKTLGVPGIRLGYVYSNDARVSRSIQDQLPIWNSNSIAECFLEIILKHREVLASSYLQTVHDRGEFAKDLQALPCVERVFGSAANFLLVRFRGKAEDWRHLPRQLLADSSIYVKDVTDRLDDGHFYLRLAVRFPEENRRLIDALM